MTIWLLPEAHGMRVRPTTFDLVINLTTAKALGLSVPPSLLRRRDDQVVGFAAVHVSLSGMKPPDTLRSTMSAIWENSGQ
jgi:hypothetical protein